MSVTKGCHSCIFLAQQFLRWRGASPYPKKRRWDTSPYGSVATGVGEQSRLNFGSLNRFGGGINSVARRSPAGCPCGLMGGQSPGSPSTVSSVSTKVRSASVYNLSPVMGCVNWGCVWTDRATPLFRGMISRGSFPAVFLQRCRDKVTNRHRNLVKTAQHERCLV